MGYRKLNELSTKNLVAQANALIRARYKTTRNEELLLKSMMSLIEPTDEEFMVFTASASQLAEILRMDKDSALREFDKITTRLMSKVVKVDTEDGWEKFQWVSRSSLKNGVVTIQFHDDLKPYLLALHKTGHFTQYRLEDIVWFRSAYTSRMYELLVEAHNKKQGLIRYKLLDFRERMLGENSNLYPLFKDFRKWVINVAQKELSQKDNSGNYRSKLNFELTTHRTGRKITDLEFSVIKQKTNTQKKMLEVSTEEEKEEKSPAYYQVLIAFGVNKEKAQKIAKTYSLEYIQEKITLFGQAVEVQEIKSPSGWLITAIEQDYKDPEDTKKAIEKQKQQEKQEKIQKNEHLEIKRSLADDIRREYLNSLSEKEKQELVKRMPEEYPKAKRSLRNTLDLLSGIPFQYLSHYIPDFKQQVEKRFKTL